MYMPGDTGECTATGPYVFTDERSIIIVTTLKFSSVHSLTLDLCVSSSAGAMPEHVYACALNIHT